VTPARSRAGLLLAVLACVPLVSSDARADIGLNPYPEFFSMTRKQWNANRLGSGRRVEVWVGGASGRPQLHWKVTFEAADRASVFAVRQGAVDLSVGRSECDSPALYFDPEHRRGGEPGRVYWVLGERHRQLRSLEGSAFFSEPNRAESLPEAGPFLDRFCEAARAHCRSSGVSAVSSVLPNVNLSIGVAEPKPVTFDCENVESETARCHALAPHYDAERATLHRERKQRLHREWTCAALLHAILTDGSSVEIVARGRDDYVWMHETVEPPTLPVSSSAWIFAPATALGDIGVVVGTTLLLVGAGIATIVTGGR
jgi:hypothetical protein